VHEPNLVKPSVKKIKTKKVSVGTFWKLKLKRGARERRVERGALVGVCFIFIIATLFMLARRILYSKRRRSQLAGKEGPYTKHPDVGYTGLPTLHTVVGTRFSLYGRHWVYPRPLRDALSLGHPAHSHIAQKHGVFYTGCSQNPGQSAAIRWEGSK